jgi:predicted metal-dependent hydrolase
VLPAKTAFFARQHGITYRSVKIGSSRGRWGSCSTHRDINFSLFLMLLPERLIDYVVLHELAHTVEMNHSPRFWQLLEKMCGCDTEKLRRETKKFESDAYRFLAQK